MSKHLFRLDTATPGPLIKGALPDRYRLSLACHAPLVKQGDTVRQGDRVGLASTLGKGDIHAPVSGTVSSLLSDAMIIEPGAGDPLEKQSPSGLSGNELLEWLRSMGADVTGIKDSTTLVINCVPPEPGISLYDTLLRDYRRIVEKGLETVQKAATISRTTMVTAKGSTANAFANCSVIYVNPVYPNGLPPLVVKAATGKEFPIGAPASGVCHLSVLDLYLIGTIMDKGTAITETVVNMNGETLAVKIGTPVGFLLQNKGIVPERGDRVVLGGLFRGDAALNTDHGVAKDSLAVSLVRIGTYPRTEDNFCLGCGECERHCPSRIMPGLISRCAEFKEFRMAEKYFVDSCIECGLCGYWCTARRPLLQYIRLAKHELALLRDECTMKAAAKEAL